MVRRTVTAAAGVAFSAALAGCDFWAGVETYDHLTSSIVNTGVIAGTAGVLANWTNIQQFLNELITSFS